MLNKYTERGGEEEVGGRHGVGGLECLGYATFSTLPMIFPSYRGRTVSSSDISSMIASSISSQKLLKKNLGRGRERGRERERKEKMSSCTFHKVPFHSKPWNGDKNYPL